MNKQTNAEELKANVERYASKTWIPIFQKWDEQGFDMKFKRYRAWHNYVVTLQKNDIVLKIYFLDIEPEIKLEIENPFEHTSYYYYRYYKMKQESPNDVPYETFEQHVIHTIDTVVQELHNEEYVEKAKRWYAINEKMNEFKMASLQQLKEMNTENLNNILQTLEDEGF